MPTKVAAKVVKKRRNRLSPDVREEMILDAAIKFFAENGFAAQTRELAAQIGVSQSLIYRYFDTKEALIERVYQKTFLSRWDPNWETMLMDRDVPIKKRLVSFFLSYLNAVDDRAWIRIVMYSSLAGWNLTNKYISVYVDNVIGIMSKELKVSLNLDGKIDRELLWHLHSSFVYYLVRKHIHRTPVNSDKAGMVEEIVDIYIDGLRKGYARRSQSAALVARKLEAKVDSY